LHPARAIAASNDRTKRCFRMATWSG
jgi:hypothetical protein